MASINRELREQLLSKTKKRRYRVAMLDASQQRIRAGIENTLNIKHHTKSVIQETRKCCPKVNCNRACCSKVMHELFPFIRIMRRYSIRKNLLQDVVAGLTVGIMHIPQGMAYGFLAQLPPIYGLYTSFFPVLLYFFFGSSRHVSIGTFAVISLMVGQVVNKGYQSHVGLKILNEGNSTLAPMLLGNGSTLVPPNPQIEPLVRTDGYANPIKLGFALSLTFVVGVVQLLMGVTRLGFLASFMSDPFISGFTTGAAVHVFSSQIKHAFGVNVHTYHGPLSLIYFYREFFLNIHTTNMVTFTASATCILLLVLIKEGINNNKECKPHLLMPVPIELVCIMVSTIVSYYTKLDTEFGVTVVGDIPSGLPVPTVHHFRYIPEVLGDGLTIGFIAFAISFSMAKILADKHGYRVNANQELMASGVCNFVSSFFSAYCSAASLSRSLVQDTAGGKTQEMLAFGICNVVGSVMNSMVCVGSLLDSAVQEEVGGKTQVVGLVSSTVVLVVLLYIGPLFESLPECILASIVIVTLKGMFLQFREIKRLWRLSKKDLAVWLVTFTAVVVLDVALGLLIGIVFSLYFVLRHSQKPQMSQLGQFPGTGAYKDKTSNKQVVDVPGMKIFRFETSIYFANAEHFRDRLYEKTGLIPRKLLKRKRRAMHETLVRRRQELEQAELERQSKAARTLGRQYSLGAVTPRPVDTYEEQLKEAAEHRLVLTRFAKAWQPPINILIIDLSVVNYVDTVAVRMMSDVVKDYKSVGIKVFLAGCKPDVRVMMRNAEFYKSVDYTCLFFTVHEAVIIGQEIVDEEIKRQFPPKDHVRLMIELNNSNPDKPLDDDEDNFNDDDEDDEEAEKTKNKNQSELNDVKSDDEDLWFDTSDFDYELKEVRHETVGLLSNAGAAGSSSDVKKVVTFKREGSLIKDDDFDMVNLKDNEKPNKSARSMY